MTSLFETIGNLKVLEPAFVSVTYGAGGSTRRKTVEITSRIKRESGIEAMAHLTCMGHSRAEITGLLDEYQNAGIENIMALRGDPPRGETEFKPHPDGFPHANDLIQYIRSRNDFCIGGAGYPEVHPEAPDRATDLENLKKKVLAGCDFIITQLFFDERAYFQFVTDARVRQIDVPIIPGIMPVTNTAQIKRFTQLCGAKLPASLMDQLTNAEPDPRAVIEVGIRHAVKQCQALLAGGAPGIHFYTLNRSLSTQRIMSELTGSL